MGLPVPPEMDGVPLVTKEVVENNLRLYFIISLISLAVILILNYIIKTFY